jgi:hypothetical protein
MSSASRVRPLPRMSRNRVLEFSAPELVAPWWSWGERLENLCPELLLGLKPSSARHVPLVACRTRIQRSQTRGERFEDSSRGRPATDPGAEWAPLLAGSWSWRPVGHSRERSCSQAVLRRILRSLPGTGRRTRQTRATRGWNPRTLTTPCLARLEQHQECRQLTPAIPPATLSQDKGARRK